MPSANPLYRRLPGTGYVVLGRRIQLWQGSEHILMVEWDGYREYYKRFDYRDIQAFVIRRTKDASVSNAVLGAIACVFGALAIVSSDFGLRVFLLCIGGGVGLVLLANAILGTTCRTSIRTAIQSYDLPSLKRLRRARKVLAQLRPLITAAQGPLPPEEIPIRMRELSQAPGTASEASPAPQSFIVDDPNAPPRIV